MAARNAATAKSAVYRAERSGRNAAGATEPPHLIGRNASPLRSFVRLSPCSRRNAHNRNARDPQHLLRRRAEKYLLYPAPMPAANPHHDQAEMEIGCDA